LQSPLFSSLPSQKTVHFFSQSQIRGDTWQSIREHRSIRAGPIALFKCLRQGVPTVT